MIERADEERIWSVVDRLLDRICTDLDLPDDERRRAYEVARRELEAEVASERR